MTDAPRGATPEGPSRTAVPRHPGTPGSPQIVRNERKNESAAEQRAGESEAATDRLER